MRVALVTGGSRAIGRAIVERLASEPMRVFFNYFQDHESADETLEQARQRGHRIEAIQADLRDPGALRELVGRVTACSGRLDVLVCSGASGVFRPSLEFRDRHWDWTFDTNVRSFLRLIRIAAPHLEKDGGGEVVALSSLGATRAIPHYGLVGASKAALEALVRQCAVELAPRAIRVNAVAPGLVDTAGVRTFLGEPTFRSTLGRTPAGRLARPDDVAEVVAFLCSPSSRMIVGQTIRVDGGYAVCA